MNTTNKTFLSFKGISRIAALLAVIALTAFSVQAQCPVTELISGLQVPLGITRSDRGNVLFSEAGTGAHDGRISIIDRDGHRRVLLAGLPSGINDVREPAGPAGLFLRGRTLYVVIGIGDTIQAGPGPGTAVPNTNPSSPIFSSVLAIHFSANVERQTQGFTLSLADHQALASGERVRLSDAGGHKITIELVVNFPDFFAEPSLAVPNNVRGSNPFDLVLVGDQKRRDGDDDDDDGDDRDDGEGRRDRCQSQLLYVTDGGRNLVWQVDINSGAFSILAVFPQVANPFMPTVFPPFIDAVPAGIAESQGQLLVTLFRGVPFPPGTSDVAQVNPLTGNPTPFITGLKTAIDVLPIRRHGDTDYLVLQHASAGPFFGSPGLLLRFETPAGPPAVIANCLTRPTSMALDKKTGTLYVTVLDPVAPGQPLMLGRIVTIPVVP